MASVVKYMFDRDFDDVDILKEIVEQEAKEADEEKKEQVKETAPEEAPAAPTFSEEELAQARRLAYERGKKEGTAETLAGIEQKIANVLDKIAHQFETVFEFQKSFNEQNEREAATLSLLLVRKLFPTLNEKHGLDEVVAMASDVLAKLIREPRVTILVNDAAVDGVGTRLGDFLKKRGFQGEFVVRGETALGHGDCRIEWMGGDAARDAGTLFAEIEAAIARHTGVALSRLDETQS